MVSDVNMMNWLVHVDVTVLQVLDFKNYRLIFCISDN